MTEILSIDPGKNSGVCLGHYDSLTPYRLIERWQVHGGLEGFLEWWDAERIPFEELVVERFILANNEFTADITPKEIEGAIKTIMRYEAPQVPVFWQPRTDKALLTGYPDSAKTKAQKQRVRFDFLDRFGLFKAGTENDDSNDAVTHALVNLKKRRHMPTMMAFWPPRRKPVA
jgi:hypothetical protein